TVLASTQDNTQHRQGTIDQDFASSVGPDPKHATPTLIRAVHMTEAAEPHPKYWTITIIG
ncbi:MAG: hypothetical protein WCD29_19410, partial [Pseudolabrys sp.]